MNKFRSAVIITVLVVAVLMASGVNPSWAGGSGTYKELVFTDTTPQTCGGWYVAANPPDDSHWVTFTRPGNVEYTLSDGTGRVIIHGTQNMFEGQAENVSGFRLPAYGFRTADWTGAKNPIRAVVTVDGDLIADVTANNPCLSAAGGQAPTSPANNPAASQTGPCRVRTTRTGIRLRGGPGTTHAVLGTLQARQDYPVAGQARDGQNTIWWQVTAPNIGPSWVISTYAATVGNCSAVPVIQAPASQQAIPGPAASAACTLSTDANGLRLRSGPSTDTDVVGRMQSGSDYAVLGKGSDSSNVRWWQIDALDLGKAWVISSYVTTKGDCSGVPLISNPS